MTDMQTPERLTCGTGAESRDIALLHRPGKAAGVFWLGGFMSDMRGSKAEALDEWARTSGHACTRFDYSGHGESGGDFKDGTISRWLAESLMVFDQTEGEQVLIGSSMGGWLAMLLNRAHRQAVGPDASRIKAIVLIAPAVDMTKDLMWDQFSDSIRETMERDGFYLEPSDYSDEPYILTRALIEDGKKHLMFGAPIDAGCPVHILQGGADPDVPPAHAMKLFDHLPDTDTTMTLIKDGDHRLSRPQDLDRLIACVADFASGSFG